MYHYDWLFTRWTHSVLDSIRLRFSFILYRVTSSLASYRSLLTKLMDGWMDGWHEYEYIVSILDSDIDIHIGIDIDIDIDTYVWVWVMDSCIPSSSWFKVPPCFLSMTGWWYATEDLACVVVVSMCVCVATEKYTATRDADISAEWSEIYSTLLSLVHYSSHLEHPSCVCYYITHSTG